MSILSVFHSYYAPRFLVIVLLSICIPLDVHAARLFSSGCELQGDVGGTMIDNLELDVSLGSPQVAVSTPRTGLSSCSASTVADGRVTFGHQFRTSTSGAVYARFYFRVSTLPNKDTSIGMLSSGASTASLGLVLRPDGSLRPHHVPTDTYFAFPGGMPSITVGSWNIAELYSSGSNYTVRVNGYTAAAGGLPTASLNSLFLGVCVYTASGVCGGSGSTAGIFYDDIAINDTSGTSQNSWPGEGKIVHMQPNGAGEPPYGSFGRMTKKGGAAGDTNNYLEVDEATPDDVSTYLYRASSMTRDDWYAVEDSSAAGILPTDSITLVQVGARGGATSNTSAGGRNIRVQLRTRSGLPGSDIHTSTNIPVHTTGWVTNGVTIPKNYYLTEYVEPTTGLPWTATGTNSLDSMQIGVYVPGDPLVSNEARASAVWALVEYAPPAVPTVTISATPNPVPALTPFALNWSSTGAASCTASNGWSGTKATVGTENIPIGILVPTTYTLTCTGPGGSGQNSVLVTIGTAPTVTLDAAPTSVGEAGESILTWSSTNTVSCTATDGWTGSKSVSGSESVFPSVNTSYTLTCTGPGGSANDSASVTVSALTFVEPTGSPLNIRTNVGPLFDVGGSYQEKGARPAGVTGLGLGADFFVAVKTFCLGVAGCVSQFWPYLIPTNSCTFQTRRVYGDPTGFGSTLSTLPCDSRLSLPAKAAGWVATGMDRWSHGTVPASAISSCTYTRLVCTGPGIAVTQPLSSGILTHPVTAAQTGDGFDFTRTPQCFDGIDNDGDVVFGWEIDFPGDGGCSGFGDNSE